MSMSDIWKKNLVRTLGEARQNAESFWNGGQIPTNTATWKTLSQFQHWYYFPDLDIFAPSKFIGYRNTTLKSYGRRGHGTYTCMALETWFTPVKRDSAEFADLCGKLESFLSANDKSLCKKVKSSSGAIYVLKPRFENAIKRGGAPARKQASRPNAQVRPKQLRLSKMPAKTWREQVALARVGQGFFREQLVEYWGGKCPVTGCAIQELLRASHMKPWAKSSDRERLDVFNGFLLVANVDAAFGSGLISFDDKGRLLLSARFPEKDARALGINTMKRIDLHPEHLKYLRYHRKNQFTGVAPHPRQEVSVTRKSRRVSR